MSNIAVLLRSARIASGLTQSELAVRARSDQSRVSRSESRDEDPRFATANRLLAAAGHRLYSAPSRRDDAATAAAAIRSALDSNEPQTALRLLIQLADDLAAEHGLLRGVLAIAEPESTGDRLWDAAIAALVDWRLSEENVPTPPWVDDDQRTLAVPQPLRVDPADPVPPASEVPGPFLDRGILVWRDTFASV